MNVHPQVFDTEKPLIIESLIGHAGLGSQCSGKMPGTFSAYGY